MKHFVYSANPARVIFGSGTISKLPEEVKRLGLSRPLVLSTPEQSGQASKVEELLKAAGISCAGQFNGAVMHTPLDVTEKALSVVQAGNVDGLVAIGGGSTIGLGKAIALRTDLPQIVLPTTYAGSEMTPIIGQTEKGVKTTQVTCEFPITYSHLGFFQQDLHSKGFTGSCDLRCRLHDDAPVRSECD